MKVLSQCHPINGMDGFRVWYTRILGMTIKDFHEEWVSPFADRKYKRVAIAAPAGSGKTQLFGVGMPLWYMWFNVSPQPPFEGLIVSTSENQSVKILDRVKDAILDNELLKELKADTPREKWASVEVKVKNGASLAVKPLNPNVRSYHVDYIFADEVSAYDKVPNGREIYLEYVSSRITRKNGMIAAVSTPDNERDLLTYLQTIKDPHGDNIYHSITTHALINKEGKPDINGESIWPELPSYTRDALLTKRQEIGVRAFNLQYLCDIHAPMDDIEAPFNLQLLVRNSDNLIFEHEPDKDERGELDKNVHYYAGYDPAFSMEGDYNAIILAKEVGGHITIVNMVRFKGDPDDAISVLKGWNNLFKLEKIVVDSNAGGSKVLRDMSVSELPASPFTFGAAERLEAFRETISRLNAGKVTLPTGRLYNESKELVYEDSEALKMREVLLNELTHIVRDQTPTGLPTYKSKTSNDDIAMCFVMLINSIPLSEDSLLGSVRRRDRVPTRLSTRKVFSPNPMGVNRFNARNRWVRR
ncbi:MAG: phage terminase large subunit family protein [Candidatus Nanoarchaeia archaeon]